MGTSDNYRIVSPELTVKAMRDSGYKNTAYALAELIDNSIDAHATLVEVFVCESPIKVSQRKSHRVDTIAVLDNGDGMDVDTLRRALKYGDGLGDDRKRIGRFGMGLPNATMSQCTKVEVWSWTNGPGNALYTYLDLDEINMGQVDVPAPVHKPGGIPDRWRTLSDGLGEHGTLVVWTNLDRVNWSGAAATLKNTSQLIGRVYRHFINDNTVEIRMAPVREDKVVDGEYRVEPNDPLYLMESTSTPEPFKAKPMFEPFEMGGPEPGVMPFRVKAANGSVHEVRIRASIAKAESRLRDVAGAEWPASATASNDAGKQVWGKHAGLNTGVSLVRRGRELDLDHKWIIGYDPVERWWGIEVDFPPELDEVFGVTNNKQTATTFSSLAHFEWQSEADPTESFSSFQSRLEEIGDPRLPLLELVNYLEFKLLRAMRERLRQQTKGNRSALKRHDDVTSKASDVVKRRRDEGHAGKTDKLDQVASEEEKRQEQVESLTQLHLDIDRAELMVDEALKNDWHVRWVSSPLDTSAFFGLKLMAGMMQVEVNTRHPLHDNLVAVLDEVPENITEADLKRRLEKASATFKLLIYSWARMEDELPDDDAREKLAETRRDWGFKARRFING
ncbi:ATP-binding protein [Nocardia aurea]|uniref:ATP-binding protein n=1 Tax=Nocardia aurea TaxID=2144174 RepID=A0ABV3G4Y3_9NOCA